MSSADQHVDPDVLAVRALGERIGTLAEDLHVASCAECSATEDALAQTAGLARGAREVEVERPPERVWNAIAGDLITDAAADSRTVTTSVGRRRWRWGLVAAGLVGAAAGIAGTIVFQQVGEPASTVVATTALEPLASWDASGSAKVVVEPDGERQLEVDLAVRSEAGPGFREVWLIDSSVSRMVSLGTLEGDTGSLPIPDGVDIAAFPIVDISLEPYDGLPAHSGDSIARGRLA